MKLGVSGAKIDVVVASGVLRLTVNPRQHWLWILSEAVLIVLFSRYAFRDWATMPLMLKVFCVWGIGAAFLAWFYQLSGSEVIEFDATGIRVRKDILGWERMREYRIEECRSLEPHVKGEGDAYGLQCKVGWRTVRFGEYISEDQANEVLSTLQKELPDVAGKLEASPSHFTTLGLNSRVS
jgi:hypothetical protein